MPFMHKLSRRLALLKDEMLPLVILSAAVVSCQIPERRGTGPDTPPVAYVVLSPPLALLRTNQATALTAIGLTSVGDTANVTSVSFQIHSHSGGAITGTSSPRFGRKVAQYRAGPTPARDTVFASDTSGVSDTAEVVVLEMPVSSVSVSPSNPALEVEQSVQLTATPKDSLGGSLTGRVVTWSSSDPALATVDGNGLVTAIDTGAVTVTATSEATSGSTPVSLLKAHVASVTVTPNSASLIVTRTVQLAASPKSGRGTTLVGRVITWSTNNANVATVNGAGLVTAMAAGSATITATCEGKNGTSAETVNVVPVASVTVTPNPAAIFIGQTVQLSATIQDSSGAVLSGRVVSWSTSNSAMATVTSNGLVTGVAAGAVTITATSEGRSGTSTVGVTIVPVASVSVSPNPASVIAGQTVQLTATLRDSSGAALSGRVVTWSTSNAALATVSASGLVQGVAVGAVMITASSEGKSGTAIVNVNPVPVATVTVAPSPGSVLVGQTLQLTATTKDASGAVLTGRVISWSSSNAAVATVNSSGLVSGVAVGSATITATSEGKSGTSVVTVNLLPVATVTVAPNPTAVYIGQTVQLTATTKDSTGAILTGRVVTWSTSNAALATVSASGLVRGVAAGSVTITATSEGKSGTSSVTVNLVPVATVTVAPSPGTVTVGQTLQLAATTKDSTGAVLTGRAIAWSSSNTAAATANGSGLVSGVAAGSSTITAASEGKSGTSSVTVQAVPPPPPPPPPGSTDTVALQIVRMDGGSGTALVSNGIPLPKGRLLPTDIAHLKVVVGGVEQPIYVEALAGRHADGTARAVLIQFSYPVTNGVPISALLITGSSITRSNPDRAKTNVTWAMTAAAALPSSPAYLVSTEVVGQTIPVSASPASPAAFPAYEANFVSYGNLHWATEAGQWTYDYYDRVLIWYAWWVRTGNAEYWRRAAIDLIDYRDTYIVPNSYQMQPHNASLEGLALHYLLTGDERSRYALGQVALFFAQIWTPQLDCATCTYPEGRIQARTLMSHYLSWMINAPGGQDWAALMATDVTKILATQQPDGSYRFTNWEWGHSNFQTGLVHDAFIKYYTYVTPDPRIPVAMKKTLDWMWANQWDVPTQSFLYLDIQTATIGGPTPSPDLNNLIVTGYAWYYAYSRDATYKTRADAIFAGGVAGSYLTGYKQFNENYTESYRYLYYRQ